MLLLTDGVKETLYLSARNLSNVRVLPFGEESAYDVLWAATVVIERVAMDRLAGPEAAPGPDSNEAEG